MSCEGSKLLEVEFRFWDGSKGSSEGILKVTEGVEALPFQAGQKVWPNKKKKPSRNSSRRVHFR